MRRLRWSLLVPTGVLALVLSGCSGSGETPQADDTAATTAAPTGAASTPAATPAEDAGGSGGDVLAAAADAATAESIRFRLTSTAQTPQGEVVTTGEGITAPDGTGRSTLTIEGAGAEIPGQQGPLELETIFVDGILYQRNSALLGQFGADAEWYSIDPSESIPGFEQLVEQSQQADPTQSLTVLREAGDVEEVGQEEVNGTATTHYRGRVTLGALLEGQGMDAETLRAATGELDIDQTVPIDVWIDGDGRIRRTTQGIEVQGMQTETTIDVLEYGVPVDVEPPPADVTVSLSELFSQMQSGGGGG